MKQPVRAGWSSVISTSGARYPDRASKFPARRNWNFLLYVYRPLVDPGHGESAAFENEGELEKPGEEVAVE
ncbi:hypothetical protein IE4803_PC00536 (plasmid) [Rhizobium etli bv. phaseoli str. IE4803]|nr:hypothetical protein IE4803_PC00536 [Rhizobium etli bv. phaseoli str. IE4803]